MGGKREESMEALPRTALAQIAGRFKLLSNAGRLEILQHICDRERTVSELVEATGLKQANVSKQLGLLDRGGLVRRRTDGGRVLYGVADPLLPKLCALVKDSIRTRHGEMLRALEEE